MSARRNRVSVTCAHCGNPFETVPSKVSRGNGKYCGVDCFNAARSAPQAGRECACCGEYKEASEFPRSSGPKRLYSLCLSCKRLYEAERRKQQDPDKTLCRRLTLLFGITLEKYREMLAAQDGRCAICGSRDAGGNLPRMPVDHDHATGDVRGLLCMYCNIGLGTFKDSPVLLRAAAAYLEKPR
jgi:hypothetical protein